MDFVTSKINKMKNEQFKRLCIVVAYTTAIIFVPLSLSKYLFEKTDYENENPMVLWSIGAFCIVIISALSYLIRIVIVEVIEYVKTGRP